MAGPDATVRIEPLAAKDAAEAAALAQSEGLISVEARWLEAHIREECEASPELALGAWEGDRIVGLSVGTDFGTYAFLGPLAVASDRQGSGIGAALLARSLAAVAHVPTVALEATESGRRLYDRRGFLPEWPTVRLRADAPAARSHPADVEVGRFEQLAALDREASGGNRRAALRLVMSLYSLRVLSGAGAAALVGNGRICAFVATDVEDAEAVLDAACAQGEPLACWAREGDPGLSLFRARGFEIVGAAPRLVRMYRGAAERTVPERVLALLSVQAG